MALAGYNLRRAEIIQKMAEIERLLGVRARGGPPFTAGITGSAADKGKRVVSAAARAAIVEGQRNRWAIAKTQTPTAKATIKPNRRLSAEGRAAIITATKRRWALQRAKAEKAA